MDKYEARTKLYWSAEFTEEYIPRLKGQAERAARAVGRKYGPEATEEIRGEIGNYILAALTEIFK
jgi:hypothetical protein